MSNHDSLFDTAYSLETPEGVELQVELAGPVVRTLAFTIDFLIRGVVMTIMAITAAFMGGKIGWAVWLLTYFIIEWLYPVVFELRSLGQTPGKKMMGITVIGDDLTPVKVSSSLIRNLLRAADFLPVCYVFGFICMAAHPFFQRLGDIAAGTLVVYVKNNTSHQPPPEFKPEPAPYLLSVDEQNAIVEFTLRHDQLSQARQNELAEILSETMVKPSHTVVDSLRGMGAWFLGAR